METKNNSSLNHSKNDKTGFDRRKFIAYSAGAGVGLIAIASGGRSVARMLKSPPAQGAQPPLAAAGSSRVVVIRSENLFRKNPAGPEKTEVERMLQASIKNLFDANDSTSALRKLFTPDDVVGIKVNCIAGPNLSTHPRVVAAIVSELEKIPIPRERITIWDRTGRELESAGYGVNIDGPGVRCYGTDAVGYEDKPSSRGSFNGRLSKILTRRITALVNVPILKNHGGAGVTVAMKNHYGSFHNPGRHHGNGCDPYIADLNSLDEIKAKTKLIVCDATRATCNGGPGYKPAFVWPYSGLILSCDPVAMDTVGARIIDERRAEIGLPTLVEAGRHPRWLASAAERGLGNTETNKIDRRTLTLPA